MHELTLFYRPTCPFCQKVLRHMSENDISFPIKDILTDSETRQELLTIGGKAQVPCLVIDGKPLYESDDIIHWLANNWSKQ